MEVQSLVPQWMTVGNWVNGSQELVSTLMGLNIIGNGSLLPFSLLRGLD